MNLLKTSSVLRSIRILVLFVIASFIAYFIYLNITNWIPAFSSLFDVLIGPVGLGYIFLCAGIILSVLSIYLLNKVSEEERKKADNKFFFGNYFHPVKLDKIDYLGEQRVPIIDSLIDSKIYIRKNGSLKSYFYSLLFSISSLFFISVGYLATNSFWLEFNEEVSNSSLTFTEVILSIIFVFLFVGIAVSVIFSLIVLLIGILTLPYIEAYSRWKESQL